VSVFLLNLAVGDLMVCFVTMTTEILFVAFGQWVSFLLFSTAIPPLLPFVFLVG